MAKKIKKVLIEGPTNPENRATVLRFNRDGRKKSIDLIAGQVLTVGEKEDITEEEAKRLMSYGSWNIKEVEDNG